MDTQSFSACFSTNTHTQHQTPQHLTPQQPPPPQQQHTETETEREERREDKTEREAEKERERGEKTRQDKTEREEREMRREREKLREEERILTCIKGSPIVKLNPFTSLRIGREQHRPDCSNHSRYMKHVTRSRSQDHCIFIHKHICTHTSTSTPTSTSTSACRCHCFAHFSRKTQSGTRAFHDVHCSKPLTFHNGFIFLLLVAVSITSADFKPLQLRPIEMKMLITRSGRKQRMCSVWYANRGGNGKQPDNTCNQILIILSKF